MFSAFKSAVAVIVGLCALGAVPAACIIVMAIAPDRAFDKARQPGVNPNQIEYWLR